MFESKYSKVLTVILVIVIVGILGLLGFLAYDYYQKYITTNDAENFVNNYEKDVDSEENENNNENNDENNEANELPEINTGTNSSTNNNQSQQVAKPQYKGFGVMGTMEIPKISLKYPILEKMTKSSIETSIAFLWGAGVNQPGNTVIVGHNYRNGAFFSNNKKLNIGDKIYITDNNSKRLIYTIYNKFETTDTDTSFYQRDTSGKAEVTLSTCTDSGKQRLIILARED